ncbi:hypothetical protein KSF_103340 [Reticulibacter mediterranei]|uniref:Uncharacterized protein n=1 Tax=Reticulibacter mediterranei TaxID=2778369 RepID=A0A8J3IT43_9CHLR|nr:hypothetical protein KSF_103340 [Reticulibacter mediterranei]
MCTTTGTLLFVPLAWLVRNRNRTILSLGKLDVCFAIGLEQPGDESGAVRREEGAGVSHLVP